MDSKKTLTLTNSFLEDISEAMDNQSYELEWYLDLKNENVVPLLDEGYIDEEDDLTKLIEEDISGERFVAIPVNYSSDKWENMREFITSLEVDDTVKSLLLTNIQGSGAFSRFKDSLFQIGKIDEWYEHEGRIDRQSALDWLRSENYIRVEDVTEGFRLYEEMIARHKQIKQDVANMKQGVVVRCQDNTGHAGRLAEGKTYKVIDERPEQLLIRIQNDQDSIKWFPKAHFGLVR